MRNNISHLSFTLRPKKPLVPQRPVTTKKWQITRPFSFSIDLAGNVIFTVPFPSLILQPGPLQDAPMRAKLSATAHADHASTEVPHVDAQLMYAIRVIVAVAERMKWGRSEGCRNAVDVPPKRPHTAQVCRTEPLL